MVKVARKIFWLALLLMIATGQLVAADAVLHGVVTDDAGKPVRGAMVKAASGIKIIARYSQNDGRYEIKVPSGTYDVAVEAFGFAAKRQSVDTSKSAEMNFKLVSRVDVTHLTASDIESLLPDTAQTRFLRWECEDCHSLGTVMRRRGSTAADWEGFLPNMTRGRLPNRHYVPEKLAALGEILEKYFGPSATYLGPDSDPPKAAQIKHAMMSDEALSATITEYKPPTPGAMPNSVLVDKKDRPWWGEFDTSGNEIGELDPATEQFHLYPMELPGSTPHTGILGKDGSVWYSMDATGIEDKLVRVNPDTGKVTFYKSKDPALDGGTHTLAVDPQGNIWASGEVNPSVFDIKTEKFRVYKLPVMDSFPEGSVGTWLSPPGLPKVSPSSETYSPGVDSKGMVYLSQLSEGTIMRLDPATGQTKVYRAPGVLSARGMIVDHEDNVWFGNYYGHTLVKLDPKTGTVKQYHPPTPNATPYGAVIDDTTGYIYFADVNGNHVTRFDPKTEKFVEYPLPTLESYCRFLGVDSKGKVWYAAGGPFAGKVGVIDPKGGR
jgi:virginiamycin B lyase